MLRPALAPLAPTVTTLLFALLEGASTSVWLACFLLAGAARGKSRRGGAARHASRRCGCRAAGCCTAFLSGIAIFAAYTLVLIAMGFARNVTYVVAFRQMSVPLGVLLGLAVLGEPLNPPKLAGVLAVTAGLVLVAVG